MNFMQHRRIATCGLRCLRSLVGGIAIAFALGVHAERTVEKELQQLAPAGWEVVSVQSESIPYGHHWGRAYGGPTGVLYTLAGPSERILKWRDQDGAWREARIGREALQVWVMPATYKRSWRSMLNPTRPKAPSHVGSSDTARVYASEAKFTAPEELDALLAKAKATKWEDPPPVSWEGWKEDLSSLAR